MYTNYINSVVDRQSPHFDDSGPLHVHDIQYINNPLLLQRFVAKCNTIAHSNQKLLFHGTPFKNIQSIITDGFDLKKVGDHGIIGRGIYLSDLIWQSIYYCLKDRYHGDETDFHLVCCVVELGKCNHMTYDVNCELYPDYNSHTTIHPDGKQLGNEYCIFDADQILPVCILHLKTSNN